MAERFADRITKNMGTLTVSQILEKVLNFFIMIILARSLSQEAFGQYGFLSSYVVLFNVLTGLGFASLLTRKIACTPEQGPRILTAALIPMLMSSLFTFFLIRYSVILTKPGQSAVIAAVNLAALDLIIGSLSSLFDTVAQGRERMIYSVIPRLARSLLLFGLYLVLAPRGLGLVQVFMIVLAAGLVQLSLQVYFSITVLGIAPAARYDFALSKKLLQEAWPLALSSIFIIIYYKIDAVMLSYMQGDRQVGLYTSAVSLAFMPIFLARAVMQATFPSLSRLYSQARHQFLLLYRYSFKYLLMAGLPISAGMALLADRIILLVYGERYLESAPTLQVLMAALFLMFINGLMGNTLIAIGGQKALMKILGISTILNVALNLIVIPRYGMVGAAAATVVAEAYANAAAWLVLRRRYGISAVWSDLFKPFLCCAAMALVVYAVRALPLFLLIALGGIVYVSLLFFSGVLGKTEILKMKEYFKKEGGN